MAKRNPINAPKGNPDLTADKAVQQKDEKKKTTWDKRGKKRTNTRGNSKFRPARNDSATETAENTLLRQFAAESRNDTALVFPTNSAAMQAFGNYTTTPGQDNFIESWNQMFEVPGQSDLGEFAKRIVLAADNAARHTANAMIVSVTPYFGCLSTIFNDDNGFVSSVRNPVELAAVNLKQYIDTSFGTNTNYDPKDLVHYLMAVAALFSVIAETKRDIRLVYTFIENQYPQFVPAGLFSCLRYADADAAVEGNKGLLYAAKNLRQYIDQLNSFIIAFNRLPIPPELGIFGYNDDLFEAVFMDSPDVTTAQLYAFKNAESWVYYEDATPAPAIMPFAMPGTNIGSASRTRTLDDMLDRIELMLNNITGLRTNANAMLQNLFNAYGSRDTIHLDLLDINNLQPVPFVYDERILTMVENMVLCNPTEVNITPIYALDDTGSIWAHVYTTSPGGKYTINVPLQFHKPFDQVSPEDRGYALRLHPSFRVRKKVKQPGTLEEERWISGYFADGFTGFAIARTTEVFVMDNDGTYTVWNWYWDMTNDAANARYNIYQDFKAHPICVQVSTTSTADTINYTLRSYMAARDVEMTYRLEDLNMHWTYLTMNVWAADVNRNVRGTRTGS